MTRLRAIFDGAPDALLVADDGRRYLDANRAACSLFGLTRDEIVGRRIDDFAAPGIDVPAAWSAFLEKGQVRGDFELVLPDGRRRTVEFHATARISPGEHLTALRGVTEQRRAAEVPREGLRVDGDPTRLSQVVSNLLTNAARYTPPGGHVWVSAERDDRSVLLRVRDDGQGLEPDLLPGCSSASCKAPAGRARSPKAASGWGSPSSARWWSCTAGPPPPAARGRDAAASSACSSRWWSGAIPRR